MHGRPLFITLILAAGVSQACGDSEPPLAMDIPPPIQGLDLARLTSGRDCPAGTGTDVSGDITTDTTWTAGGSPYRLENSIRVSATLRLEACVVVQLAKNVRIQVGNDPTVGKLIALGEAQRASDGTEVLRPVLFEAKDPADRWGSLVVDPAGSLEAYFLILMDGAHPESAQNDGGVILAYGRTEPPPKITRSIEAKYLLISGSGGHGVNLQRRAAFTENSEVLVVANSGGEAAPYPVRVEPGAISSVPKNSLFQGNQRNEILVDGSIFVAVDDTIRKAAVPYRVLGPLYVQGESDGPTVTLTIEPGAVLRFEPTSGSGIYVGSSEVRQGRLVAAGSPNDPIVFTSSAESPAPADWMGIFFRHAPATGNRIDYAIIEYAGAFSGAQGYGCGPLENDASILILSGRPTEGFVTNTAFRNVGGDTQIVLGWTSDEDGPDFVSSNNFADSPACRVGRWQHATPPACPEPQGSGCL